MLDFKNFFFCSTRSILVFDFNFFSNKIKVAHGWLLIAIIFLAPLFPTICSTLLDRHASYKFNGLRFENFSQAKCMTLLRCDGDVRNKAWVKAKRKQMKKFWVRLRITNSLLRTVGIFREGVGKCERPLASLQPTARRRHASREASAATSASGCKQHTMCEDERGKENLVWG